MSGHSKWKTIQHKKNAADAKRGKTFSRLAKELMIVARDGGGDPDMNARLRSVVATARAENMPLENIERAIKKGTGELEGATIEEIVYEAYMAGVAIIVVVQTDNRNRAAAEIRHIFTRHHTSFAGQGSVLRSFKRKGQIWINADAVDEETLMGVVLDAGAEDMKRDGDVFEILTEPSDFGAVLEALEKAGIAPEKSDVAMIPDTYLPVTEKDAAATILRFIDALEEHDDVQNVYTNMDIDDAILAELEEKE